MKQAALCLAVLLLAQWWSITAFCDGPSTDAGTSLMAEGKSVEFFREIFLDPPARFRILPIVHRYPLESGEQDGLLTSLTRRGFGGLVTNVPFTNYLRDEAMWNAFTRFVGKARERGMAMWLYDEKGYPSGKADGLTLEGHPEWEARGLYFADDSARGGPVQLDLPPGKLVRAAVFPVKNGLLELDSGVDLAKNVEGGKLSWTAPTGEWRVVAITEDRLYEATHAELCLSSHIPYINLLLSGPTKRFIELTHGSYAARLGGDLGKYFTATFTDEPSLMSMLMRPRPYRIIPWSQDFSREFKARRGYEIEPLLAGLIAPAGPRAARARYDFWLTTAELVCENFFLPIRDICRKSNTLSGGHLLCEEQLLTHVPLYGDLFRCEKMLDAPSLDCLTSNPPDVPWYSARLVSSAGELTGRPDNMCETSDHAQRYRPKGDKRPPILVTEDQIRGTCNRLMVNGITCITSYYALDRFGDDVVQRLNLWTGRVCAMLYDGHQVSDVAVVYPIESVWPRFEPAHNWTSDCPESAKQVERIYRQVSDALFFNRRDFTYIDAETLAGGNVADGVLRWRDLSWRVVILPCVDTLPLKAWQNLAEFWRSGGAVIDVGALPANSESEFPSSSVQRLAREMFGEGDLDKTRLRTNASGGIAIYLPERDGAKLPALLNGLMEPDVKVAPADSPPRFTHRRRSGHEIFFLVNDSATPWEGEVSLSASGKGEQYDPATGAIADLPSADRIVIKMGGYVGVLFRFNKARASRRYPDAGKNLQGLLE